MNYDAIIKVRFRTTEQGGRKGNIMSNSYSCPMFINNEAYDCRLFFENNITELGKTYLVPIKFLNPNLVMDKLSLGKKVILWEGKDVADAIIEEII